MFEDNGDLCEHDEIKEDCVHCRTEAEIEAYDSGNYIRVVPAEGGTEDVTDDTMDTMIQRASVPSLATLFKRGKDAGLLKPTQGYAGGA